MKGRILMGLLGALFLAAGAASGQPPVDTRRGDRMLAEYFRAETASVASRSLEGLEKLEDWTSRREQHLAHLREMLGLQPMPERSPLQPVVTGRTEHPEFTVERLQFQSRPGLYVTGNLYLPRRRDGPAPAILYVCGHGNVKKDGVSYGSKTAYQHHGGWFARNGYVCLTIDTLQLGEIEGIHHGTHREGMWWWKARGYTPAGVEAWNCIRALDYLETRPEVDRNRLGVTGRSGGGAYSWWIAALDERIKAAVPVAGITDLQNHVVDGAVEGHCDCMFMVNTYRWDYAHVAALVAPRPLLLSNSDKDSIFPLEGVVRVHAAVRKVYRLYGAEASLGLLITEGPHRDTQDLQVPAIRWFNRHLKNDTEPVRNVAEKFFEPEALKVFKALPTDQKNTTIHESFVPMASPAPLPGSAADWARQRDGWLAALREKSFRGWPAEGAPLEHRPVFTARRDGVQLSAYDFTSQQHVRLRLYVAHRAGLEKPELVVLNTLDDAGWERWQATMAARFAPELTGVEGETLPLPAPDEKAFTELREMCRSFKWAMAYLAPRGVGPTAWDRSPRKQVQHRRRFMLLGQTRDGMRVWDVRRAAQALRVTDGLRGVPLWLQGEREMAGIALYAALFEPDIARLDLWHLPRTHRDGPIFLNVLRFLDMPQALAMGAERSRVVLYQQGRDGWEYPTTVAGRLGWEPGRIQIRRPGQSRAE